MHIDEALEILDFIVNQIDSHKEGLLEKLEKLRDAVERNQITYS